MRPARAALTLAVSLAVAPAGPLAAQEHRHLEGDAHGEVHFPVTCEPAVQPAFDRAVAILHSYGYDDARRRFRSVAEQARRAAWPGGAWR